MDASPRLVCPDCGQPPPSNTGKSLIYHRARCSVARKNDKNRAKAVVRARREKRKAGHGFERGASVAAKLSVTRTRTSIIADGKKEQDRGVKYSATSLWAIPSIHALASKKIAEQVAAEATSDEDSDSDEEGEWEDIGSNDFCPEVGQKDNEQNEAGQKDVQQNENPEDEEEEEVLVWKEIQEAMDAHGEEFPGRQEKIEETKEHLRVK